MVFAADVKSAFLHPDPVSSTITNYGIPTRDMQRILNVDADTYMHLVKPMFDDTMAPKF